VDALYRDLNQKAAVLTLHRNMCTLNSSPDDIRTLIYTLLPTSVEKV